MKPWNKKYPEYWKCFNCKNNFRNRGTPRKFCSYKCYWTSIKGKICPGGFKTGKNHWNYNPNRNEIIDRDKSGSIFGYPMYRAIAEKCNFKCQMCGFNFPIKPIYKIRKIISFDHKIAIRFGGEHSIENGQLLCRPCNKAKTRIDFIRMRNPIYK